MKRLARPFKALVFSRTQPRVTHASGALAMLGGLVLTVFGVLMVLADPVSLSAPIYQRVVFAQNPDAHGLVLLAIGLRLILPHTNYALLSYSKDACMILGGVYIALCGWLLGQGAVASGQAGFSYTLVPVGLMLLTVTLGELFEW